jgi:ketosteroid isomerase-like protein
VESIASALEVLINAEGQVWFSGDDQAFRAVFTEDAIFTDKTFGDLAVGIDAIEAFSANLAMGIPTWKGQLIDRYIGLEGGITVNNIWNLELGGHKFTQDDPLVEVDWLQTRDNHITSMTCLYSLDTLKNSFSADQQRLDQANSLLSSFQSAWSSGDQQVVSELHSSDSVREDSLFGEMQPGREAIGSFAKLFFAWFPRARWSLSMGFGEGRGDSPKTGGLFVIRVNDLSGQPCDVRAVVLLQTAEDQIVHEDLFYEPQSLIKCGWAR